MKPEERPDDSLLVIKLTRLEKDAQGHARLMYEWGRKVAHARHMAKAAKNRLKLVAARMAKEVRTNPGEWGIDKVTESSVEAAVISTDDYVNAQDELLQLEYDQDILEQFMFALRDRGEQIGVLARLHGQMYWAKPDTNSVHKEQDQATARAAADRLNRRKK